jgi:spore coat polysaccharide biosynthesis protein SpsF
MTIIASIQARTGSTRLPGKVLKPIAGKPMLQWQIERIRKSRHIDNLVVATSTNASDDAIAALCQNIGVDCFRGSEEDVLGRVAGLITAYPCDYHVEFCGDSPLISAEIIDSLIGIFLKNKEVYDAVCNSLTTTYPPGQEVIIYRAELLLQANDRIQPSDPLREHCGIHVTKNASLCVRNIEAPAEYHYPELYMEVDTENDLFVISKVFEHFEKIGQADFTLKDIIGFFASHPELASHNQAEIRRWKTFRE